jgi:flagellar hook-associated protein 3 FlgL
MATNIYAPMSTLGALQQWQFNASRAQAELQQANQEVSTGLKANLFADLGQTAAIPMELQARMDQADALATSNQLLGNKMEVISTALGTVHDAAQNVLALAVSNAGAPQATAKTLQQQARAALDTLTQALNTQYAGDFVFSGTATDKPAVQAYTQVSAATGKSPQQALAAAVGGGPVSAADAAAKLAQLDAMFASSASDPTLNYEGTFYNGTPAQDASGAANPRVTAQIAPGQVISYGVQANDPAIRKVMEGLSMLASTDVSQISDPAAYKAWMSSAVSKLSGGVDGVTSAQAELGSQQQLVAQTATRQGDMKTVYNSRILGYESVDPYAAASRLSALQTQLQATYAATSQLSKLSLLNYL